MMRKELLAIAAVVVVVGSASAVSVYYLSGGSNSPTSTTCIIPVEGEIMFKVLNSTTDKPIASVPVQVERLYPECSPNPHTTENLGTLTTNVNGTIIVGGLGEYYFHVNYHGTYSVNASIGPVATTCVVLRIPSGNYTVANSRPLEGIKC